MEKSCILFEILSFRVYLIIFKRITPCQHRNKNKAPAKPISLTPTELRRVLSSAGQPLQAATRSLNSGLGPDYPLVFEDLEVIALNINPPAALKTRGYPNIPSLVADSSTLRHHSRSPYSE